MASETSLKEKILSWAKKERDVWLNKYHGSPFTLSGHPDVYGSVNGIAVFFELKKPGKDLSEIQGAIGRKIARSGAVFRRIESFSQFLRIVEQVREARIVGLPKSVLDIDRTAV